MAELTILTGASRGMGLAMAEQLCTPGRTLLCIARGQSDELSALAQSHGTALTQWQADLSRPQAVAQLQHQQAEAEEQQQDQQDRNQGQASLPRRGQSGGA